MECFRKFLAVIFPSGDDINFEAPSWRLGEGSRLVVGVRLLFLDGRVLDSTGSETGTSGSEPTADISRIGGVVLALCGKFYCCSVHLACKSPSG